VLLVSRDEAYQVRAQATVAQITTRIRGIPAEIKLGPDDGVPRTCAANVDTLLTIPLAQLSEFVVVLSAQKLRELDGALRFALGIRY
jgi:mRNA interferase MazF